MGSLKNVVLAMALIPSVSSCNDDHSVIWSADIASPDGAWLVHAETIQQSGPGNAAVFTEIGLGQRGQHQRTIIVGLSHSIAPRPLEPPVAMRWSTNRKLTVEYDPSSEVNFQAVKLADIEVTAEPMQQDPPARAQAVCVKVFQAHAFVLRVRPGPTLVQ